MDEMIVKVLSSYGLAGLVIAVLGYTVYRMYGESKKVNEQRLADVPVLIKALENNTQATKENAAAILARNLVTEELSKAIERQATIFELFMQKYDMHEEALKDRLQEFKMVIDSSAEAQRSNTAALRVVRDHVDPQNQGRI